MRAVWRRSSTRTGELEQLADGFVFTEGPAWNRSSRP